MNTIRESNSSNNEGDSSRESPSVSHDYAMIPKSMVHEKNRENINNKKLNKRYSGKQFHYPPKQNRPNEGDLRLESEGSFHSYAIKPRSLIYEKKRQNDDHTIINEMIK